MKRLTVLFLALATVLSLCACKTEGNSSKDTTVNASEHLNGSPLETEGGEASGGEPNVGESNGGEASGGELGTGGSTAYPEGTAEPPSDTAGGTQTDGDLEETEPQETETPITPGQTAITPAVVYYNALQKLEQAGSYEMKADVNLGYFSKQKDSEEYKHDFDIPVSYSVKVSDLKKDSQIMRTIIEMTFMGYSVSDVYSEGEWLYHNTDGEKKKMKADPNNKPTPFAAGVDLDLSDLQIVAALQFGTIHKEENGDFKLAVTLTGQKIDDAFGRRNDKLSEITELRYNFVVDSSYTLISAEGYSCAIAVDGSKVITETRIDYLKVGDVIVEAPEGYLDYPA